MRLLFKYLSASVSFFLPIAVAASLHAGEVRCTDALASPFFGVTVTPLTGGSSLWQTK